MASNGVGALGGRDLDPDSSKNGFLDDSALVGEGQDGVRIVDEQEENNLSRSLGQRHIQMIALAGAIV